MMHLYSYKSVAQIKEEVLILVVMDDALVLGKAEPKVGCCTVLILVVMDDALVLCGVMSLTSCHRTS